MKTLITAILLISTLFNPAFADDFMTGSFSEVKGSYVMIPFQKDCEEDGGQWDAEAEICLVQVADEIRISKKEEKYSVQIVTWGGNLHSCAFEGPAKKIGKDKLQSTVEGAVWGENDWEEKDCVVDITFNDKNSVSVEANWACQIYCGMRAVLNIENASRN